MTCILKYVVIEKLQILRNLQSIYPYQKYSLLKKHRLINASSIIYILLYVWNLEMSLKIFRKGALMMQQVLYFKFSEIQGALSNFKPLKQLFKSLNLN